MKKLKYLGLMLLAVSFSACDVDNELDEIVEVPVVFEDPTSGSADFTKYVAIGASFTAGFSDGSVYLAAQSRSFPSIIASQMESFGGGAFTQPLVNDNIGGLTLGGQVISNPRFYFYSDPSPTPMENLSGPYPVGIDPRANDFTPGMPTTEVSTILTGPFNNMGVPGAKSFHTVAPGYGSIAGIGTTANPYFVRMASSPTATMLGDAAAQNPTFFTISEIGGNDVLSYATSGGTGVVQTGNLDPSTYGGNDITDTNVFASVLNTMVTTLTANGAKGAIVTVPSIVNLPFFTTVPHNAIPLDAATAAQLNAGYAVYNASLSAAITGANALGNLGMTPEQIAAEVAKRTINFSAGQNAVVIIDEDLTDLTGINTALVSMRQATADDFLVLTSSSFLGTTVGGNPALINGVTVPLADNWVLTPEEQNNIQTAVDAYNVSINAIAMANDLAVVDVNQLLADAAGSGTTFDDFTMTTSLVFGGLVSLDGIHLTSRGYALMANKILEAVDAKYGSNFAASGNMANANDFPTNYPSPPGI